MKLIVTTFIAVIASWMIHEFAHWATGELLGNTMVMTLNTTYPASGQYIKEWHAHIISAAGPLITLVQATLFYLYLKRSNNLTLFPFLITCLYMRLLAGAMNVINLNDEGRIGEAMGIGVVSLPVIVIAFLSYLVYSIIINKELKGTKIIQTVLLIMLFSSFLILSDQAFKIIIL